MSSSQVSVISEPDRRPSLDLHRATAQEIATGGHRRGTTSDDDAMFKLSRRLWSLEIHRRLALQARRMI